jgi:hypothetical protein
LEPLGTFSGRACCEGDFALKTPVAKWQMIFIRMQFEPGTRLPSFFIAPILPNSAYAEKLTVRFSAEVVV